MTYVSGVPLRCKEGGRDAVVGVKRGWVGEQGAGAGVDVPGEDCRLGGEEEERLGEAKPSVAIVAGVAAVAPSSPAVCFGASGGQTPIAGGATDGLGVERREIAAAGAGEGAAAGQWQRTTPAP